MFFMVERVLIALVYSLWLKELMVTLDSQHFRSYFNNSQRLSKLFFAALHPLSAPQLVSLGFEMYVFIFA